MAIFLDRDGVINKHLPGDYVRTWADFEWLPQVREAIFLLSKSAERIIIVTNQQGVAKGLMSAEDVETIHTNLRAEIAAMGGRVDAIYFAPELKSDPDNRRKPKPDMALEAKADFPEIDFTKSIMIGDTPSDMRFGKELGMRTVLVRSHDNLNPSELEQALANADTSVESLWQFALNWTKDKH